MTLSAMPAPPTVHNASQPFAPSALHAPLRVLVLTHVYPWPGRPYEGAFLHEHVRALAATGVQCRVLAVRPATRGLPASLTWLSWLRHAHRRITWPRSLDAVPVDYVLYPQPLRPRSIDVTHRATQSVLGEVARQGGWLDADVIYAQWFWPNGVIALALRERMGIPVAVMGRGNDLNDWCEDWPESESHIRRVLGGADVVLTNSEAHRARAIRLAPSCAARSAVVYNGCDTTLFRPTDDRAAERASLGLDARGGLMLYCGRVSRRKGAYDLAAAWQLAAPHLPDWRLLVVGEATEREAVARLRSAASATGGRLLYRGFVPPGDVPRFMRAADVLVHASYGEGLANVTFEAMASGLPIVSSNVDGQPEAIIPGETGWLVPPRNPRALADALIDAATDAAARGVQGARARRIACERFARSRQAASLAAILGDVARRATPTRA